MKVVKNLSNFFNLHEFQIILFLILSALLLFIFFFVAEVNKQWWNLVVMEGILTAVDTRNSTGKQRQ